MVSRCLLLYLVSIVKTTQKAIFLKEMYVVSFLTTMKMTGFLMETHMEIQQEFSHIMDTILLHALWMKDLVVAPMMKIYPPGPLRELNQTALLQPQPLLAAVTP